MRRTWTVLFVAFTWVTPPIHGGDFAYYTDDDGFSLVRSDLETGATLIIGSIGRELHFLDLTTDDRLFGVDQEGTTLVEVDTSSGSVVSTRPIRYTGFPAPVIVDLTIDTRDRLYLLTTGDSFENRIWQVDLETGVASRTDFEGSSYVCLAATGERLIGIGFHEPSGFLTGIVDIDLETGSTSLLGTYDESAWGTSTCETDDASRFFVNENFGQIALYLVLIAIDLDTGEVTYTPVFRERSASGVAFRREEITTVPTLRGAGLLALAAALAGAGALALRRRRRPSPG